MHLPTFWYDKKSSFCIVKFLGESEELNEGLFWVRSCCSFLTSVRNAKNSVLTIFQVLIISWQVDAGKAFEHNYGTLRKHVAPAYVGRQVAHCCPGRWQTTHCLTLLYNGLVHLTYNSSFLTCFFSWNIVFLSQQISQQCFSAGLSAQPNGTNVNVSTASWWLTGTASSWGREESLTLE
jgi:hypothetical protein